MLIIFLNSIQSPKNIKYHTAKIIKNFELPNIFAIFAKTKYYYFMRDLKFHQNNAVNKGICPSAVEKWLNAENKSDLVKLSLTPHYIPSFVTAIYAGWGVSSDYIKSEFKWFTNGKKIMKCSSDDGVDYQAVCMCQQTNKTFDYNVDVVSVIDSRNTTINVLNYSAQYHISNSSKISLKSVDSVALVNIYVYDDSIVNIKHLKGNVVVYKYSANATIVGADDSTIVRKRDVNEWI